MCIISALKERHEMLILILVCFWKGDRGYEGPKGMRGPQGLGYKGDKVCSLCIWDL